MAFQVRGCIGNTTGIFRPTCANPSISTPQALGIIGVLGPVQGCHRIAAL